jgi:PAS domain S-box-containing protein
MNSDNRFDAEKKRLETLRELNILDTDAEKEFDDIVKLASIICQTPISLISLLDEDRQWFKSIVGSCMRETKREEAFCNHTIRQGEILMVPNALEDSRFNNFKMVAGPEHIRFYAGIPIIFNGESIGALCVKDREPRTLSNDQLDCLKSLSQQISRLLELRLQNIKLEAVNHDAESQKAKLRKSNDELNELNLALSSSEEELKASIEHINLLQSNLEGSEKLYRELVENANDLIYELDATGRFTFTNNKMEKRTGFDRNVLCQKHYWDLVHPEDLSLVLTFYKEQMKARRETSYLEFRMLGCAGEEVWIGQNVKMLFENNGWVYRVVSVSRDITHLKRIETKLAESEKLYRLLSTNSTDIICLFDLEEGVTFKFISPSVEQVMGYKPEDLIGKSPFHFVYPDDLEHTERITRDLTLNGQASTIEYRAMKKNGEVIWLESNSNPIFDSTGKVTGFQTSARDISRRKEFEESLKEAKQKAEEVNEAKSHFLSMMSHEIRTPMNAIIGLTNLMSLSDTNPEQQENLRLLRFSGENLLTIINDILDFSKIEAKKIELERVEFNLRELISNTKQVLEQKAVAQGIAINLHCETIVPIKVLGDPVRISQVLTNLIGNAIKFTEEGSVDLIVRYKGKVHDKQTVSFEIKDTGIGIAPEKLGKIFEGFSQAESDTTRKYGGTGLGLSITRKLLELMGSEIEVKSELAKGSTFSFTLSLEEPKGVADVLMEINTEINASTESEIHVLLVEDNKVNQIVACGFLKRWGISADIANDGTEALKMVVDKDYDIVLMDLQMPNMDGYEASRAIRRMEGDKFTKLPIIALTASAMLGMNEKVLNAGMTDFITKPFSPDELRSKILKYTVDIERSGRKRRIA